MVGLACGVTVTTVFHWLLLPRLLSSQHSFKLSLEWVERCCRQQSQSQVSATSGSPSIHLLLPQDIALQEIETGQTVEPGLEVEEHPQVAAVFRPLQVVVASFAALNHGGNDVGNCIGPLVTIWFVYQVRVLHYYTVGGALH